MSGSVRVVRATTMAEIEAAAYLFDQAVGRSASLRFLADPTHHLLLAWRDEEVLGFVSGIETTHPDKGTEMFVYELEVGEAHRRQGVGTSLVRALAQVAEDAGCYGMWVLTDHDNAAALATYRAAGAEPPTPHVMLGWSIQ